MVAREDSSLEVNAPDNKIKSINSENFSLPMVYMFIKDHIYVGNTTYEFNLIYKSFRREICKSE